MNSYPLLDRYGLHDLSIEEKDALTFDLWDYESPGPMPQIPPISAEEYEIIKADAAAHLAYRNLLHLNFEQRLELAAELRANTYELRPGPYPTPPEVLAEMDRRGDEYEVNPELGIPWELIHDEALARARK